MDDKLEKEARRGEGKQTRRGVTGVGGEERRGYGRNEDREGNLMEGDVRRKWKHCEIFSTHIRR